ncbi:hypothetical protein M440DRAFT_1439309 [Trichoderma longibrachiatum ATCC 18648]|uniref:Uncharacterized protein n=1 Tax=Trichoderma longibrachiatum ATCC 18648 TaxID=983965 RepID=A0A2T4C244_TRILO|nr:hypothetical protein M440DRAFT_1439309 [Trichoderma longibrachiatum ATCC 18648]
MEADSEIYSYSEGEALPPQMVDPNWNVLDHLSPFHKACYMHHQRHRLTHLKALGVYHADDQHILLLDEAGFLSAVGVALPTREQLQRQPHEFFYGKEAEQEMLKEALSCVAAQVLDILEKADHTHAAWKSLRQLLKTDPFHHKTPNALLKAVKEAGMEEEVIWMFLPEFGPNETAAGAVIIPFKMVLRGICMVVGYASHEITHPFEQLMEIDEELCENVYEFRDMYQRMTAHVVEKGSNETEIINLKIERLRKAWEKVFAFISKGYMKPKMDGILRSWGHVLFEEESSYSTDSEHYF